MQIFKVQRPVACTPGAEQQIFAYNRDRSVLFQGDVKIEDIRELFPGDEYKVFRYGYRRKDGALELKGEAPWQSW